MEFMNKCPEIFTGAADPMVLMQMPGCYDVFVNTSHERFFSGAFKPVSTPRDYEHRLKRELTERPKRDPQSVRCYCDKTDAVVALNPEYCVFETIHRQP